ELNREAVVCPAQGIQDGANFVGCIGGGNNLGCLLEILGLAPADGGNHLRGVARIELLHDLEDAARVLHGFVNIGELRFVVNVISPGRLVGVGLLLWVPSTEKACGFVERVAFLHQECGVGVELYIIFLNTVVGQRVVNDTAKKGDVAARPNLDEFVRNSG